MKSLTNSDLLRKADQESEMGSLAMGDADPKAASKHFAKAQEYMAELYRRRLMDVSL